MQRLPLRLLQLLLLLLREMLPRKQRRMLLGLQQIGGQGRRRSGLRRPPRRLRLPRDSSSGSSSSSSSSNSNSSNSSRGSRPEGPVAYPEELAWSQRWLSGSLPEPPRFSAASV